MTFRRCEGVAARALAGCLVVAPLGCGTTHQLGKVSPTTVAVLRDAGKETSAYVQIQPLPSDRSVGHRVRDIGLDGVSLDVPGPPIVVPFERVGFISTYDHARGAQRGAVIGGITGLVLTGVLVALLERQADIAARDGGGGGAPASGVVLLIGAGTGLGALIGAGFGAISGYEDRYVVMH
jgi:hypothetical protein